MNPIAQNKIEEKIRELTARGGPAAHPGGGGHRPGPRPTLHVCGLNHVRTPIALREHYALSVEQSAELTRRLAGEALSGQLLVLSTCNRTEIYAFGPQPHFADRLRRVFLELGKQVEGAAGAPPVYEYAGLEAVRHLFAVGAGLDSMILGENQIKQQIAQACETSRAEGALGADLTRAIDAAHRVGKRIRTETDLNVGTLCVGKAAVLKGEQILGELRGRVCLVIGAGKIGELAARAIAERHPGRLWIVNRTVEKAQEIAGELGGEAYGLDSLSCLLPEAEFIVGAAYAPELIMDRARYESFCPPHRRPERLCIVDAAVPRIIDPGLGELGGVELFDIEHMEEIVEENRRRREGAAEHAWRILEEELGRFQATLKAAELAPVIQCLHLHVDRIFEEEQAGLTADLSEELLGKISLMQHRIKQRLMHEVIQEVKARLMD